MIKSGHISGSRVMHIMTNNLKHEMAEEVLSTQMSQYVPSIIGKYLPTETYDSVNSKMFESCREILASGRFTAESTQQMLVSSMIGFVHEEALREVLSDWYFNDKITDTKGDTIADLKLTLKQKHSCVKKIHLSRKLTEELKKKSMVNLMEIDKSELIEQTKAFCVGTVNTVEEKKPIWDGLFATKYDEVSLLVHREYCAGLCDHSHHDVTVKFEDEFFSKIEEVVNTKPNNKAEIVFLYLQPSGTTDAEIKKFEDLLKKSEANPGEAATRLQKWVKESICTLREKQDARKLSAQWEATRK